MKIECCIPEVDNIVRCGATAYHFRRPPGGDGPMTAEVGDETHANELLGRPEFRLFGQDAESAAPPAGSEGESEGEGSEMPGGYVDRTLDELRELYLARFGRAAHPAMKPETIAAKLADDDAAKAAAGADGTAPPAA